jgi:hypothetical protein
MSWFWYAVGVAGSFGMVAAAVRVRRVSWYRRHSADYVITVRMEDS